MVASSGGEQLSADSLSRRTSEHIWGNIEDSEVEASQGTSTHVFTLTLYMNKMHFVPFAFGVEGPEGGGAWS